MPTERERRFVGPRRGQFIFAVAFLVFAAVLLGLIGEQTRWVDKTKFFAQPRFWPAVGLLGMTVLAGLHLYRLPWWHNNRFDRQELRKWAVVIEFAGWFMVYVLLVPVIGYLPVTLAFVPALSWRMGYRDRKMLGLSVLFACVVVLLFKTFLGVKIPGGAIYEFLPGALRGFAILYL
ncbi:MAG: tripartite tricarboxylate transporter TctB family protein [Pseudomonadota bacterium]